MSEHDLDAADRIAAQLHDGALDDALAGLRRNAAQLPLGRLAGLVGQAAAAYGFDDLVAAAGRVQVDPADPRALYDLGYACLERGLAAVAVPVLQAALARLPQHPDIIEELVAAYEDGARYGDAVALLSSYDTLPDWPLGYLLAFHAVMAGDLALAARTAERLGDPGSAWRSARDRLNAMLARAGEVSTPLDGRDLRGWHYVLNGAVLTALSPYGVESMRGRYAWLADDLATCRRTLDRAAAALRAAGRPPARVGLLPDRGSQILGLAAAQTWGLPAAPWQPGTPDTLVLAYDLRRCGPDVVEGLRRRAPGEVLLEHATCWTDPPYVAADLTGLLVQSVVAPWDERPDVGSTGEPSLRPADQRPTSAVVADLVAVAPTAATGTGADADAEETAPGDSPADLAGFVTGLLGRWPGVGSDRDRVWSPGPVASARFG